MVLLPPRKKTGGLAFQGGVEMRRLILFLAIVLSISGCYKTVYMNVQGNKNLEKAALAQEDKHPAFNAASWQHFFIYRWIPSEKTIDAANLCGGAEHIVSINTQQNIVQLLVQSAASYYINIYSPYDGNVVCDNAKVSKKTDSKVSNAEPELLNAEPD
jgi:hypothetical protein